MAGYIRRALPKDFDYTRWLVEKDRSQLADPLPQPPFKEPEPASKGVEKALKRMEKFGIKTSAHEILIQSEWIKIVGPDLAKHTIPGNLDKGNLTVYVMGSAWLAELRRSSLPKMIRRINEHHGETIVKSINLRPAPSGYKP